MKTIKINWLDNCPKCGHEDAAVTTQGNEKELFAGEQVTCMKCGHNGEIDADEGGAFVCWDELDNSQEGLKVWE